MPERRVRVVVPLHCFACSPCPACSDAGVAYATLADPAAEALMADGEKWRERVERAIAALREGLPAADDPTPVDARMVLALDILLAGKTTPTPEAP